LINRTGSNGEREFAGTHALVGQSDLRTHGGAATGPRH
jgi:hypothetical protein